MNVWCKILIRDPISLPPPPNINISPKMAPWKGHFIFQPSIFNVQGICWFSGGIVPCWYCWQIQMHQLLVFIRPVNINSGRWLSTHKFWMDESVYLSIPLVRKKNKAPHWKSKTIKENSPLELSIINPHHNNGLFQKTIYLMLFGPPETRSFRSMRWYLLPSAPYFKPPQSSRRLTWDYLSQEDIEY